MQRYRTPKAEELNVREQFVRSVRTVVEVPILNVYTHVMDKSCLVVPWIETRFTF